MDEYSATDRSVILTQRGKEGGQKMREQTVQLQHQKKKKKQMKKTFYENISEACFFMWNDSSFLLLSNRDVKRSKTPEADFLKSSDMVLKGVIQRVRLRFYCLYD